MRGAPVLDLSARQPPSDPITFAVRNRIGMWGHSRGGMMTYIALTRTDRIPLPNLVPHGT